VAAGEEGFFLFWFLREEWILLEEVRDEEAVWEDMFLGLYISRKVAEEVVREEFP